MAAGRRDVRNLGSYENILNSFRRYDTNRDNKLSFAELNALMKDLNEGKWQEAQSSQLMTRIDRDQNGTVDIDELLHYVFPVNDAMGGEAGASDYEKIMTAFRRFDGNRNGTLCKPEFTRVMQKVKPGWEPAMTEKVFAAVDTDKSGEVASDELVAWLFGVPPDRQKAAKKAARAEKKAIKAGADPSTVNVGPLVVVEMIAGSKAETEALRLQDKIAKKMGNKVRVDLKIQGTIQTITKVSARDGQVVFWDSATMMAFRDNPFTNMQVADQWVRDLCSRDLPRLLAGT